MVSIQSCEQMKQGGTWHIRSHFETINVEVKAFSDECVGWATPSKWMGAISESGSLVLQ